MKLPQGYARARLTGVLLVSNLALSFSARGAVIVGHQEGRPRGRLCASLRTLVACFVITVWFGALMQIADSFSRSIGGDRALPCSGAVVVARRLPQSFRVRERAAVVRGVSCARGAWVSSSWAYGGPSLWRAGGARTLGGTGRAVTATLKRERGGAEIRFMYRFPTAGWEGAARVVPFRARPSRSRGMRLAVGSNMESQGVDGFRAGPIVRRSPAAVSRLDGGIRVGCDGLWPRAAGDVRGAGVVVSARPCAWGLSRAAGWLR